MQDDFIPQVGYRDLRFGMSSLEATALLGPAAGVTNIWEEFDYDPEDYAYAKGRVDKSYEGYPPFHEIMDLSFKNDRLVEIRVQDALEPIWFEGLNLFDTDRKSVVAALFEMDQDLYGNRRHGFFGTLGLILSWPSGIKQGRCYLKFVDSEDVFDGLDFFVLDPLDAPLK